MKHRLARLSTRPRIARWGGSEILAALAALATLGRLALVLVGWPETTLIADDAYYYFTIARHLALGDGPTFDGLAPTNGFQPLWQFLIVPLFQLPMLWWPVRAVGVLEIACDVGSALVLRRWLGVYLGPRRGAIAATLWLTMPLPFLLGLRGMEAAAATLLTLLCLWQLSRGPSTPVLLLGALLGLAGLARLDHLVSLGLSATAVTLLANSFPIRRRVVRLALVAAIASAIVAPWLLWCRFEFGSFLPVSGQVKWATDQIVSALPRDFDSPSAAAASLAYATLAPLVSCVRWLAGEEFSPPRFTAPLVLLSALFGGALLWPALRHLRRQRGGTALLAIAVFALTHQVLFGLIWRSYSVWYAHPLAALSCFCFAALPLRGPHVRWRRVSVAVLLSIQVVLAILYVSRVEHGARGVERQWNPRFERVVSLVPEGGRIGAWDAGAAGYVAFLYPQITIVNLDGLVNNRAFTAVRAGRYADYLLAELDYLIQPPQRARMYLDPAELEHFLYEFERRGQAGVGD